ncbi:MAG: hypothetical protein EZS28_045240 [Streblomastix strix]|uniref:Uncharacterized protein n=1 Tax=Streblomastix strix TaxID=222440 RepID=A0A5J4TN48_9EUKA|nr:MAG: hypothetical protein EZS28_045240 [Streblomastix strix]
MKFITKDDDIEGRKQAVEAGIADALLKIFSTYPLESITPSHAWAFFELKFIKDDQINYDAFKSINFTGLVRLLNHPDITVVHRATISIQNILVSASCDGINKLFILFKKNLRKRSKDEASICIGHLFRAKEIPKTEMRKEVISYLKAAVNDSDSWMKTYSKYRLRGLVQDAVNRAEIEKDGFKIPE